MEEHYRLSLLFVSDVASLAIMQLVLLDLWIY